MTTKQTQNTDISLYGLLALFLKNWLTLVVCGVGFCVLAIVWSLTLPNVYTAETTLMPIEGDGPDLSSLAGNLGGLAAMAGLNLNDDKGGNAKLALELVKSREFIGEFIEENELLVPLMASEGWDLATDTLLIDPKKYDTKSNKWVRQVEAPFKPKPSLLEAHAEFVKLLEVEQDPKSKFVKLSLDFYSPFLAAEWTEKLVKKLNDRIRNMDLAEADRSIVYLQKMAAEIQLAELKNVFSTLVEEQLKSKMLATVKKDYVFEVVDPAVAPELKSKPKRALIVIVAGFLGGIVGIFIILFREGKRQHLANLSEN